MKENKLIYHMMALFTICIWGTTFVSTKILLELFSPLEIMFYRFIITYMTLIIIYPKIHKTSFKEEGAFVLLGVFGGSLYFIAESTALKLTLASHVGFLLAAAPILTALIAHVFTKDEKISKNTWIGFGIAIVGVFLVIFNGTFVLKLTAFGELLAVGAGLSWAFYTILLKKLGAKYTPIYTTRKVFFYAILTMIPMLAANGYKFHPAKFRYAYVIMHLLFLGLIASALCFILWNMAVKHLGAVKTNNYIYFNPVITMIASSLVLKERITLYSGAGSALIMLGVYLAQNKMNLNFWKKKTANGLHSS